MSISYYHLVVGKRVDFSDPGNERSFGHLEYNARVVSSQLGNSKLK